MLSRPFVKHEMVTVVEITQEEDFRIDKTIAEVIALLRGPGDMFFVIMLSLLRGVAVATS